MRERNPIQFLLFLILMLDSAQALDPSKPGLLRERKHETKLDSVKSTQNTSDFEIRTYSQTVDHFNYGPESYATFQQRYAINFQHWGGANTGSPIFFGTGGYGLPLNFSEGFIFENAPRFKALLVLAEHRYNGESNPFGSKEVAFSNSSTLQYFSSAQALADYAELITNLKKNLSAESSPVIVVEGSYGGMLAAWFRLKYPNIAIGALASSAPILYFEDLTPENGYSDIVTKNFRETSESCYETIKSSWFEIDKIAAQPNGLIALSRMFNTCRPLIDAVDLKNQLEDLCYVSAQFDDPSSNPVATLCHGIDGEPHGTSVLQRFISGLKAAEKNIPCFRVYQKDEDVPLDGWAWQACTEMVMPIGDGNDSIFQRVHFDMKEHILSCQRQFHVTPRPHWITTQYGGHNIKQVLENFGSNIIFSNGLRDPWSIGGVLENISRSIVALVTTKGSHCLDLSGSKSTDPEWLISQRNKEVKIMESWIADYNARKTAE